MLVVVRFTTSASLYPAPNDISGLKTACGACPAVVLPFRLVVAGELLPLVGARSHFPFEVNHVEVYNNIKFSFARFAGSALFLRQKTHSPANVAMRVFILCNVNGTTLLYVPLRRNARIWFFSFHSLVFGSLDNIYREHPSRCLYVRSR